MNLKLLDKFANNKCNPDELLEVLNWIQQTEEQSGQIVLKQYWDIIKADEKADSNLSQQRLDRIHHRINLSRPERILLGKDRSLVLKKTYILQLLSKIAVALLIPVITLFIYTRFFQADFIATNTIISPHGSRIFLELSDGTKVWLNHGSKLIYPQKFIGDTRTVMLSGEGYFLVAHNPARPFIVESKEIQVKAVGTVFNVRAYDDGSDYETTLESGKILVQKRLRDNESIICTMTPGQHFSLNHKTTKYSLKSEETFKYVAWKDGKLIFDDDRLDRVAERLSQWYNVDIILKDPKLIGLTYKATFVDENLSQILDMMQVVMPIYCVEVKREKSSDGVFMKKKIVIYLKTNN